MSIRGNSVGLPTTKGLVEKYHDYNQHDDMVVKFRDPEKDCRNNEDADELATNFIEDRAIRHSQKQQWHHPQPQVPKRPAIQWENFLPLRSLKVLLVENDDSTRYTVSALLRNCSYEVTAVSNGLEAWETLEDLTNRVDLVLTEVAMPCLSGIDLLSKITSEKTCKNIPVIMMSCNDSMNIVFKCLSSGAVDFLVKPIRKNELKNLWQHVWRKCHQGLGGGSGSESGIQSQNSTKSKSVDGSNNDTDLKYEEGNGSTGLTFRNGSDNDSGNQSACSKRALEVHSSEPIAQLDDDMANLPDSTSENWVSTNTTRIIQIEDDEHDDVTMGKDLTLGAPRTSELQLRNPSNQVLAETGVSEFLDLDMNKDLKKQGKEVVEDNTLTTTNSDINLKDNDAAATVCVTNFDMCCGESNRNERFREPSKVKHVESYDGKEPSLELSSLQRLRDAGSSCNILRRSDHSAFSRYNNNTSSTNKQALTRNVGSCSSINNSLEAGKIESMPPQLQHDIISGTQNQGSNGGSSNNFDMGSTSNCVPDKPESLNDKSVPRSSISVDNCHAFQPVRHGHCASGQTGISDTAKTVTTQGMAQVEHHRVRGLQQQPMSLDSDDLSSGNIIDAALHCGTSNKSGVMGIEGKAANYESASGSNNGSNGRNSIVGGTNMAVDNNAPGNVCVSGSGNKSGTEQDRLALREAALIKFRQKRKDRCFDKKVRYQRRKMLAEQRPRVRGQDVRFWTLLGFDNRRKGGRNRGNREEEEDSKERVQFYFICQKIFTN